MEIRFFLSFKMTCHRSVLNSDVRISIYCVPRMHSKKLMTEMKYKQRKMVKLLLLNKIWQVVARVGFIRCCVTFPASFFAMRFIAL